MIGPSEERLTRSGAQFVGFGALAYLAVLSGDIVSQAPLLDLWWTVFAVGGIGISGASVVGFARWGPVRAIRLSIYAFGALYFAAAVLWFAAYDADSDWPSPGASWIGGAPGLVCIGLAIIRRWPLPVATIVPMLVPTVLITARLQPARPIPLLLDLIYGSLFVLVFTAACGALTETARLLDRTAEQARKQAAATAANEAREAEQRRFDALIHDGVLATLLSAASPGIARAETARQARAALDMLSPQTTTDSDSIDTESAIFRLRAAAVAANEAVAFEARSTNDGTLPRVVVETLAAGIIEAVRNTVRHAQAAQSRVIIEAAPDGIRTDITDNGKGFDRTQVEPHRLGLAASITGRFDELPGGWSEIDSTPGQGTRVTLGWRAS